MIFKFFCVQGCSILYNKLMWPKILSLRGRASSEENIAVAEFAMIR